ncbi:four-carbon acid sugar kinase family protein [Saccharopolyspora sp. CA-218241]|uniref:FadR/GntR family transcriptional regulator n=1 Tax=Saccharopolyspora sp. CA-218241 TaxID=3240027 RepID=UPI003D97CB74
MSLPDALAERLLASIIDGSCPPGSALPAEAELAERFAVSRLTVREAVTALRVQGVVRIERGRGTYVNPPDRWTALDPMIRAATAARPSGIVSESLIDARRLLETGAAELAAAHRTEHHLRRLRESLRRMREADAAADVAAFVAADIDFHGTIMLATGNAFIPLMFEPFERLLVDGRRETSAVPEIRAHALAEHGKVLRALEDADPGAARSAMHDHLDQTATDLRTHVLGVRGATPEAPMPHGPMPLEELMAGLPPVRETAPAAIAEQLAGGPRLVLLDDDPTGTQAVSGIPVLTSWAAEDLRWALRQPGGAFFVLTNTRSLSAADAVARNRDVVDALAAAAAAEDVDFVLASRSDSTLRGHYPAETDGLAAALAEHGRPVDAAVIVPAFPDAGRVTLGSVHWARTAAGMLPAGRTEFAADASFGYRSSDLRAWVEEKTGGRIAAADVRSIDVHDLRTGGPERVAEVLRGSRDQQPVVVDAACDDDLRVLALGALAAESAGTRLLYRCGPGFVRARTGQAPSAPLDAATLARYPAGHGLIAVGSHVGLTTRQLDELRAAHHPAEFELDVPTLLDPAAGAEHLSDVAARAAAALADSDVVLRTSRTLVTGADADDSLAIARTVSAALVRAVGEAVRARRPAFVVAKGGITSSDIATGGLDVRRAIARGTLLPGMVSLWEPVAGEFAGVPYVVFPGNVGDERALADVVTALHR